MANYGLESIGPDDDELTTEKKRTKNIGTLLALVLTKDGVLKPGVALTGPELIHAAAQYLDASVSCDPPCPMRRKIKLAIVANHTAEECGVPDSEVADFWQPDLTGVHGHPVIKLRYCPWCGRLLEKIVAVTDINCETHEGNDEGEEWKKGEQGGGLAQ